MIYFSTRELFLCVTSFFLLGIFAGGIHGSLNLFFAFIKECVTSPKKCYIKYKLKKNTHLKVGQNKNGFEISTCFSDLIFVSFFGVLFILFSYFFLDGIFRIYSLVFCFLGYVTAQETLGELFSKFLSFTFDLLIKTVDFFFYLLLYPHFLIIDIIKRLFLPIIRFTYSKYQKTKYAYLLNKKLKEIEKNIF